MLERRLEDVNCTNTIKYYHVIPCLSSPLSLSLLSISVSLPLFVISLSVSIFSLYLSLYSLSISVFLSLFLNISLRFSLLFCLSFSSPLFLSGGAVAQSLERTTPGDEVPGSIPAVAARSLLVGSVLV